ncbi:hypothetical protein SCUP515_00999 [Seiridium cupressi]
MPHKRPDHRPTPKKVRFEKSTGASSKVYVRQLDSHQSEIRLLELYQPRHSSKFAFKCKLKTVKLYENYSYAAVSYCWGDLTDKVSTFVNRHKVRISKNLHAALHQLWHSGVLTVWVDFLCINQADDIEKGSQVAIMGKIYSAAQIVYAWLGPRSFDSDLAMAVLRSERHLAKPELPENPLDSYDAVIRLLNRSYFSRTWIIQEICLARQVTFICGDRHLPFKTLVRTIEDMGDSPAALYARHLFDPIKTYRNTARGKAYGYRDSIDIMLAWVIRTRKAQAGDPRDKLYALISLAADGHQVIPAPNYKQSLAQVLADVTTQIMTYEHLTAVMFLSHRTDDRRKLPSWVPNWTKMRTEPPAWLEEALYAGRGSLLRGNTVAKANMVLTVTGIQVDKIIGVMKPSGGHVPYLHQEPWRSRDVLERLRMCLMSDQTQAEPQSHLGTWMQSYGQMEVGSYSIREHLIKYHSEAGSKTSETEDIREITREINDLLTYMEQWRMVMALGGRHGLQLVYREAMPGDRIFSLERCEVNAILRREPDGHYKLIGEVLPLPFIRKGGAARYDDIRIR